MNIMAISVVLGIQVRSAAKNEQVQRKIVHISFEMQQWQDLKN
jgi:hypothetical protein